eukprot:Rhum_TRINITY_DN12422_c0_g1::Rhum_TRINITY_DN12422_c0_g1_i1::g.51759::m.51759
MLAAAWRLGLTSKKQPQLSSSAGGLNNSVRCRSILHHLRTHEVGQPLLILAQPPQLVNPVRRCPRLKNVVAHHRELVHTRRRHILRRLGLFLTLRRLVLRVRGPRILRLLAAAGQARAPTRALALQHSPQGALPAPPCTPRTVRTRVAHRVQLPHARGRRPVLQTHKAQVTQTVPILRPHDRGAERVRLVLGREQQRRQKPQPPVHTVPLLVLPGQVDHHSEARLRLVVVRGTRRPTRKGDKRPQAAEKVRRHLAVARRLRRPQPPHDAQRPFDRGPQRVDGRADDAGAVLPPDGHAAEQRS